MRLREKNGKFMAGMRGLHALIGTATVISMMQAYDTFKLEDGDMYRYAQTYHFCVVVVGYTSLQYGAWYCIFVSYMQRMSIDDILERFLDVILLIASLVCGYLTNLKTSCPPLLAKETYGRCSHLHVTMYLCFANAVLFSILMVYSFLVSAADSHPDNTMNLVPRGNYGVNFNNRAQTPRDTPLQMDGGPRGPSVPMLSPLWDVLSTVDKAPVFEEDKTGNLNARGHFGDVKIDDVDKTDKLMPRGNFGSIALN